MAERKTLSKRTRFEIFKRDGFKCVYCGANPTAAVLRVDHVAPVAGGGSDAPSNLVTSCFDCNAGKSDVALSEKRHAPTMSADNAKDHADQILEYLAAQREVIAAKASVKGAFTEQWERVFGCEVPNQLQGRLARPLNDFSLAKLVDAIDIVAGHDALGPHRSPDRGTQYGRAKYFFGILRAWRQEANQQLTAQSPTADRNTIISMYSRESRAGEAMRNTRRALRDAGLEADFPILAALVTQQAIRDRKDCGK